MNQLAAVATRGTPADPVLLKHHHTMTPFNEGQRGGNTRETTADDADFGFHLTIELSVSGQIIARGGVVRACVLFLGQNMRSVGSL